jgi:hypothetical protein
MGWIVVDSLTGTAAPEQHIRHKVNTIEEDSRCAIRLANNTHTQTQKKK